MLCDAATYSIAPYTGGHVVVDAARGTVGDVLVCDECGAISVQELSPLGHRCPVCMAMVDHSGSAKTAAEVSSAMGIPIAPVEDIESEFETLYIDIADFESEMREFDFGKSFL